MIIGKSNTGKSTLELYILYLIRRMYDVMIAFCPTPEMREKLELIGDIAHVGDEYDEVVVRNVLETGRLLKNNGTPRSFLITMDDCGFDKKVFTSKTFRELTKTGRNLGPIGLLILIQYCMDMTKDNRSQIDVIMVLADNSVKNRESLYDQFFGMFPDKHTFDDAMVKVTDNFGVLVLDNTVRSNKIEDCVFAFKAKLPIPRFHMGAPFCRILEKRYCGDAYKNAQDAKKAYDQMVSRLREKKNGTAAQLERSAINISSNSSNNKSTRGRTTTRSRSKGSSTSSTTSTNSNSNGKRKVASPMQIEFDV
jgi:hypothetical protein